MTVVAATRYPAKQDRTYADIEDVATRFRSSMGLEEHPIDGLSLFDALDGQLPSEAGLISVDHAVARLGSGVEARTEWLEEERMYLVTLAEDTYAGLEDREPRARFTLLHEVGHLVLHAEELREISQQPELRAALNRGAIQRPPAYRDVEWQANAFAAAVLMPAADLAQICSRKDYVPLGEIQRRFGVSVAAAEARWRVFNERRDKLLIPRA